MSSLSYRLARRASFGLPTRHLSRGAVLSFAASLLLGCAPPIATGAFLAEPSAARKDLASQPAQLGDAQILAEALRQDARVRSQAAQIERSLAGTLDALSAKSPNVSLSLTSSMTQDGVETPTLALVARQSLIDFGANNRNAVRKDHLAAQSHLDFLEAVDETLAEVLTQISALQESQTQITAIQKLLLQIEEIAALHHQRSAVGFTGDADYLEILRATQSAQADLARAQADEARAQRALQRLSGSAARTLPPLPEEESCHLSQTPDLASQRAALNQDIAVLDLRDAQRARWPLLVLEAQAQQPLTSEKPRFGLNFKLETSLFTGSETARLQAAQATITSSLAEQDFARLQSEHTRLDARSALSDLERQSVQEAQETDLLTQLHSTYHQQFTTSGTRSLQDLLDLTRQEHQAHVARLSTTRKKAQIVIDCLHQTGALRATLGLTDYTLHGVKLRS